MSFESLLLTLGTFWFFGLIVAIAINDALYREIPNRFVIALAFGAPLFVLGGLMSVATFTTALSVASGLMVVGTYVFSRGWIGGGDVKYLAAAALWFAPSDSIAFVCNALILGAILALAILLLRVLVQRGYVTINDIQRRFLEENLCVPYGVSISASAAFSFWDIWL